MNELAMERLYVGGEAPRRMIFARMSKVCEAPFLMPTKGMQDYR